MLLQDNGGEYALTTVQWAPNLPVRRGFLCAF